MARIRVKPDDLEWAATWLEAYEGDDDEPPEGPGHTFARVAAWLRQEAAKREEDAAVRQVVKATGASPSRAREAVRKASS